MPSYNLFLIDDQGGITLGEIIKLFWETTKLFEITLGSYLPWVVLNKMYGFFNPRWPPLQGIVQ